MPHEEPLDLRHLPVWERAAIVRDRAEQMALDDSFEFLTEVNPRALISRLEQQRPHWFAFESRRLGEGQWHIVVKRVFGDAGHAKDVVFERNPQLARLSARGRDRVRDALTESDFHKGEAVCSEDESRDWLGIVLDGALGVFAGAGSRERLLLHLYPYDLSGEIELLDGGLAMGRTVVLSRSARIARIPYAIVRDLLSGEHDFLLSLARLTAQHSRTLSAALSEQVHQPILSRVANALLPYAAPERGLHPSLPPLSTMTQTQVAAAAGTVKEVAARAIAELERAQALRRERGRIAYLDRSTLLAIIDRG